MPLPVTGGNGGGGRGGAAGGGENGGGGGGRYYAEAMARLEGRGRGAGAGGGGYLAEAMAKLKGPQRSTFIRNGDTSRPEVGWFDRALGVGTVARRTRSGRDGRASQGTACGGRSGVYVRTAGGVHAVEVRRPAQLQLHLHAAEFKRKVCYSSPSAAS